jgi:hypothetical protein
MISCASLVRCAGGAVLALTVATAACTQYREPIIVEEGVITIENQTNSEWKDIRVVVNDYFGGSAPSLAPGARMNAILSGMQTGFGQRFDRSRMSVYKIEVFAKDAAGNPVKLKWGSDRTAR